MNYRIDTHNLEHNWPDGHSVPKALTEIACLIQAWPAGSVGYFSITGARLDDYWIELGSDLSAQFGQFLHFDDGTVIALWFHEGVVPNAEPVIELGSEGNVSILAPNLKSFLTDWADGRGHQEFQIFTEEVTPERARQRKDFGDQMRTVIQTMPDHLAGAAIPSLDHFLDNQSLSALSKFATDPIMQSISNVLKAHLPAGQAFETVEFRILIAGSRIEILVPFTPESDYKMRRSLPEQEALIPLILKAREQRAAPPFEARGLWNVATLVLHNLPEKLAQGGHSYIKATWDQEPKFEQGGRVSRVELEADFQQFPRSARWMESWMDQLE